jgi:hypothetical protein
MRRAWLLPTPKTENCTDAPGNCTLSAALMARCNWLARPAMVCGIGLPLAMSGIVMGSGGGAVEGDETPNEMPQLAFAVLFAAVALVPAVVVPR